MTTTCNIISTSISCASFATNPWTCLHDRDRQRQREWIVNPDQITAPEQYSDENGELHRDQTSSSVRALKEQNCKKTGGKYIHVPHKDKPPQIVARRNARERRRVEAVNSAFTRLRKAVPLENNRGKRVSKVKTLQNAIKYIQKLQELLHWHGMYEQYVVTDAYCFDGCNDFFEENFEENFQY